MSSTHHYAIARSLDHYDPLSALVVSLKNGGVWHVILIVSTMPSIIGCQSLSGQSTQRSAQCSALCDRARAAREQGNLDQANRYVDEALSKRPCDFEMQRQLAESLWKNGRQSEAIAQFVALHERHPHDAKIAVRLAVVQWELKQHSAAGTTAVAALELDPQSKDAWQIKARSEVERGQLDEGLVSYLRLFQIAPDDLSTLLELGELHVRRGNPDRACPLFRTAMQHPKATQKQRRDTEWMLGVAYARCERWSAAVAALEHSIDSRSQSADDWCFLAWARVQSGDLIGAQSDLQRALKRDPDSVAARKLAKQLESMSNVEQPGGRVTPVGYQELE